MERDNPDHCQTATQTTYWDNEREAVRNLLRQAGLAEEGKMPKPWVVMAGESLASLRGNNRQVGDRAILDLAVAVAIDNAIDRLVDASNSNTAVMSRLQKWMIGLTGVYVLVTVLGVLVTAAAK